MANKAISTSDITIQLQNGTERTFLASWVCSNTNVDHYESKWQYNSGDKQSNGNLIWLEGSSNSTTLKNSTYDAPANAKQIRFKVKPVSKTHTVSGKTQSYWSFDWSGYYPITISSSNLPATPAVPAVPTVTITGNLLTASVDTYDTNTDRIEFQVYSESDSATIAAPIIDVKAHTASFTLSVPVGGKYKVRCRGVNTFGRSAWSEYSSTDTTVPFVPENIISCKATTGTSVMIEWTASKNATGYVVEYADDESYFGVSDQVKTYSVEAPQVKALISGLDTGKRWFFRVKATNDKGSSGWTRIVSVITGSAPDAPTTWSDTGTVIIGNDIVLHWSHNASDSSDQSAAEIQIYVNGTAQPVISITGNQTYANVSTSGYTDGSKITWKVRTKGIIDTWGAWSTVRTIMVYVAPTVLISSNIQNGVCTGYPINITLYAEPSSQSVVGCTLSISSNETYETIDNVGNPSMVLSDQNVYYSNIDSLSNVMSVSLTPGDVNLDNNISYTINVSVTMETGLSAYNTSVFNVMWVESNYYPQLGVGLFPDIVATLLYPTCTDVNDNPITDVILSVYRREFNGEFTEIATNIPATSQTNIIDPHPALDYARYRVVAQSTSTGGIGYVDIPGIPIGETAIIIQWDQDWQSYIGNSEDPSSAPILGGSLLRLPYNIDTSESYNIDTSLVNYIGRKRPVSYYGTQLGETATWSVEIRKEDVETLFALRRLAVWTGDAYVREPSGSGYWANIKVSMNQTHNELTIPVSLAITRVEGGI